jgi:hypothetical protein
MPLRQEIAKRTAEAEDPNQLYAGLPKLINREAWSRFIAQGQKSSRVEQAAPMAKPTQAQMESFEQDPEAVEKFLGKPAKEQLPSWGQPNMKAVATKKLGLSDEEQFLYQHHLDNLAKGGVAAPGGKTSTILAQTVESDGKHYVIPTVWDNKIVSGDQATKNAQAIGFDKFPSYDSEVEAENRYMQMHDYMDKDTQ